MFVREKRGKTGLLRLSHSLFSYLAGPRTCRLWSFEKEAHRLGRGKGLRRAFCNYEAYPHGKTLYMRLLTHTEARLLRLHVYHGAPPTPPVGAALCEKAARSRRPSCSRVGPPVGAAPRKPWMQQEVKNWPIVCATKVRLTRLALGHTQRAGRARSATSPADRRARAGTPPKTHDGLATSDAFERAEVCMEERAAPRSGVRSRW